MRHRRRGRRLGRSSSHRKAMLRNLASSLFLTEREMVEEKQGPKVAGRVVTTLHKAKEVRPLVEKCITIARRSLQFAERAEEFATDAKRESDAWRTWRQSDQWRQWCEARAPVVAARRRALQLLGDKEAVEILFEKIAPRFVERPGGYTRLLRLATPRLGDAGIRAILEFVGVRDRVSVKSEKPSFSDDDELETTDESLEETSGETAEETVDETVSDPESAQEQDASDDAVEKEKSADE